MAFSTITDNVLLVVKVNEYILAFSYSPAIAASLPLLSCLPCPTSFRTDDTSGLAEIPITTDLNIPLPY